MNYKRMQSFDRYRPKTGNPESVPASNGEAEVVSDKAKDDGDLPF